ncbi:MAG: type 4a pilus biogenesis protein PilO [Candidatus Pacebacteria bacterium]|nr:type 4a pilus biogenesis protein PilO [Candidatus Paceibacterota bacterium]
MEKRLFAVPILIFLALLVFVYFVFPEYKKFLVTEKQVQYLQTDIKDKNDYYAALRILKNNLVDYRVVLDKINSAIPQEPFSPDLLTYFQKTASDSGLLLGGVAVSNEGASGENPNIKIASVSLVVMGPLNSFENFLKTVEKSARVFDVKQLSFTVEPTQMNMTTFTLIIKTYSY